MDSTALPNPGKRMTLMTCNLVSRAVDLLRVPGQNEGNLPHLPAEVNKKEESIPYLHYPHFRQSFCDCYSPNNNCC